MVSFEESLGSFPHSLLSTSKIGFLKIACRARWLFPFNSNSEVDFEDVTLMDPGNLHPRCWLGLQLDALCFGARKPRFPRGDLHGACCAIEIQAKSPKLLWRGSRGIHVQKAVTRLNIYTYIYIWFTLYWKHNEGNK